MIKVCIDPGNAMPTTGIGVYSSSLINAFKKYCIGEIEVYECDYGSPSYTFRPLHRLIYLWNLRRKQKNNFNNSQIVHFTNFYAPPKFCRAGFVTTIHDLDVMYHPETYTSRYKYYFEKTVRNSLLRSNIVLTDTEASRVDLLGQFPQYESKVMAIPTGLSEEFIDFVNVLQKKEKKERMMLFVGSLSKKKNITWLINVISEGMRNGAIPSFKLVLVGNAGFGFNDIYNAMKDAKDIILWKKNLTKKELAETYINADVVVLPSITEGFGIPLLEAMYCGKPIVASSIPTSIEVAAQAAYFFQLDNCESFYFAVNEAFKDSVREERLKFISTHIKKYLWINLVNKYKDLYKKVSEEY